MKIEDIEVGKKYTFISTINDKIFYVCTALSIDKELNRVEVEVPELKIAPFETDPYWLEVYREVEQ